ncbi:8228_t:CDS:1, partial [Gigaspora margarita]
MPCYADMIVCVKFVRQGKKSMWAIGAYPLGREDCEIEIVLFVPTNLDDYNLETYAMLEKDCLYSIGGKIVPGVY